MKHSKLVLSILVALPIYISFSSPSIAKEGTADGIDVITGNGYVVEENTGKNKGWKWKTTNGERSGWNRNRSDAERNARQAAKDLKKEERRKKREERKNKRKKGNDVMLGPDGQPDYRGGGGDFPGQGNQRPGL